MRVWSIAARKCVMRTAPDLLGAAARAIAWSPDGTRLAVGLGGDADSKVGRRVVEGLVEGSSTTARAFVVMMTVTVTVTGIQGYRDTGVCSGV